MEYAEAFSPGHVTGLFSIHEEEDPMRQGSLGAGFCVAQGVTTSVSFRSIPDDRFVLNDDPHADAMVSRAVIRLFYRKVDGKPPHSLHVEHRTELPIGCGFGTSGAGALSLALALNALHGDPLSFIEAAALAHLAEIECKTGLGTVIGETFGGFEIRIGSGAPGVGRLASFHYPKGLKAIFLVKGPLSTSGLLKNTNLRERISHLGSALRQDLQNDFSIERFLKLSREFSVQIGLLTPLLHDIQNELLRKEIVAPMLMFGEGLFTLALAEDETKVLDEFRTYQANGKVFSCDLDPEGGRVVRVY